MDELCLGSDTLCPGADSQDCAPSALACTFCLKPSTALQVLIKGPGVYICNECVELCVDIIEGRATKTR